MKKILFVLFTINICLITFQTYAQKVRVSSAEDVASCAYINEISIDSSVSISKCKRKLRQQAEKLGATDILWAIEPFSISYSDGSGYFYMAAQLYNCNSNSTIMPTDEVVVIEEDYLKNKCEYLDEYDISSVVGYAKCDSKLKKILKKEGATHISWKDHSGAPSFYVSAAAYKCNKKLSE